MSNRVPISFLSIILLLQIIGFNFLTFQYSGNFESFLFLNCDLSESLAKNIELFLVFLTLIFGILIIFKNYVFCAYYIFSIFFINATLSMYLEGSFSSPFDLLAHLIRFTFPIAIIFSWKKENSKAINILKYGLAGTFFGHGLEALFNNPLFIDFLITAFEKIINTPANEKNIGIILVFIFIQDLFLAFLVLKSNNKAVLYYMAGWGFLTSVFRVYYFPEIGFYEFLLRSSHSLIPLCLIQLKNYPNKLKRRLHHNENKIIFNT